MKKLFTTIICKVLYLHNWSHQIERHTCEGISSHIDNIDIHIRECKFCNRKQLYNFPKSKGHFIETNWIDTNIKPNEHLIYKRIKN